MMTMFGSISLILCLPPTVNTAWLLKGDVNTLGVIVAGLSIYAATTLRLIINRDAFSLQRQLKDILYSPMKASQTELETQALVTGEFDTF